MTIDYDQQARDLAVLVGRAQALISWVVYPGGHVRPELEEQLRTWLDDAQAVTMRR